MMEMAGAAAHTLLGNVQGDQAVVLGSASIEAPIAFAVPGPVSLVSCQAHSLTGIVELHTFSGRGTAVRHFVASAGSLAAAGDPSYVLKPWPHLIYINPPLESKLSPACQSHLPVHLCISASSSFTLQSPMCCLK